MDVVAKVVTGYGWIHRRRHDKALEPVAYILQGPGDNTFCAWDDTPAVDSMLPCHAFFHTGNHPCGPACSHGHKRVPYGAVLCNNVYFPCHIHGRDPAHVQLL